MPRLLLLLPTTTYRTEAFVEAARRLEVDLTVASEEDSAFSGDEPAGLVTLDFAAPERAAAKVVHFASDRPIHAVFGVDDDTALVATVVSEALGLSHNPVKAMEAARNKHLQRCMLRERGVPMPEFVLCSMGDPVDAVAHAVAYPCVIKPTSLNASRGVMRANNPDEFHVAHERLAAILEKESRERHERRKREEWQERERKREYLVERFVPGPEFALEGLLRDGRLHVLALFDKPDPLDGPFFEETIYVTPSRFSREERNALVQTVQEAVHALGLERGPIHCELRYNEEGPWLIELAARPIGGKCGQVLRFGPDAAISLEELVLAQALNRLEMIPPREEPAAGVMMIPIPQAGVLREVRGLEEAFAVRYVTDVIITAHRGQRLVPLPEESRYLGFIFARAEGPMAVERALRDAHAALRIEIG
jgi:biotin carboxylase